MLCRCIRQHPFCIFQHQYKCAQVYNLTTYPHLVGFFEELGVETEPSEMSFALSVDKGNIEWGSHGLDSVFAQRKNLISPTFLAMLYDVVRFGREAPEVGHAGLCTAIYC